MEEEHDPRRDGLTNFRQAAIDHMAYIMEVTGTLTEVDGPAGDVRDGVSEEVITVPSATGRSCMVIDRLRLPSSGLANAVT